VAKRETFYEVLGVDSKATAKEIRAAYLKLVNEYHPDRHQDNPLKELAAQKLVNINQAYQVLSDPKRRAIYDGADESPFTDPPSQTRGSVLAPSTVVQRILLAVLALLALPLLLRFGLPLLRLVFRAIRLVF
jgi:DnaJ-class molecular chaperone